MITAFSLFMGVAFYQVDGFADLPFTGNPAAVCLLDGRRDVEWMQDVASEMNLSETAFVQPDEDAFRIRWFTPTVEVDLCGHATLAAAHALWSEGRVLNTAPISFSSRGGALAASRQGSWIELDFPSYNVNPAPLNPLLKQALGAEIAFSGATEYDQFVELASAAEVRDLRPNLATLARIDARGIIVTSRGDSEDCDFVSRFFAPRSGIPEDPVTGSAHCALGPYWQARLGRNPLIGYQASPRGGRVRVRVAGDRVRIAGQAVTVVRGELMV